MFHRKHGFQKPIDVHQCSAAVVYTLVTAGFYVFSAPLLEPRALHIALQAVFALLAGATLGLNIVTTLLDPSDFGVPPQDKPTELCFTCLLCQKQVQKRSKHCKRCNKCVDNFDHHCEWLNHCIGRRNYKPFFGLLCATSAMLLLHLAVNAWLLADSYLHAPKVQLRQRAAYGGHISTTVYRVIWCVYIVVLLPLALLMCELLAFHIILFWKGMSTYDYILARRAAAEARSADDADGGSPLACRCRGNSRIMPATAATGPAIEAPRPPSQQPSIRVNPCAALRMSARPVRTTAQRAKHSSMAEYMFLPQPQQAGKRGEGSPAADPSSSSLSTVVIETDYGQTELADIGQSRHAGQAEAVSLTS